MLRNLPVLVGIILILTGLILFGVSYQAISPPYQYKGNALDPPVAVPDFQLQTADGALFHLSDLDGKIALIFFGYTHCPDVCPLTVAKVQFIFISVDPARDPPEVLARYLSNFDANFIGLTDDLKKVQEVMKAYWAYAEKEGAPQLAADPSQAAHRHDESSANYMVTHTGRVYLVTPARELLLTYPFEFEAEELRSDLIYLLN